MDCAREDKKCYCVQNWESDCPMWPYPRTKKFEPHPPGVKGRVRFLSPDDRESLFMDLERIKHRVHKVPNRLYGTTLNRDGEAV